MELPTTNIKQLSTLNTIQSSSSSSPSSPVKQIFYYILNSSVSFKTLCASLLVGYLLTFIDKAPLYLAVIPGRLLPPSFFLWTLITHGFIEHQIFQVILNMFIILLYCKMLEPLWGTLECIKFYFITTTIVAVETTLVLILLYMMTFKEVLIFNTLIHGLSGFIGGFTVAIKQIMPDTMLLNFGVIRIKQDDLPLVVLIISTILHLIKLIEFTFLIMLSFGLLNGWIYLRFFQVHKNGNKGDSSVTFSFASFFPSIIQPFVAIISNTIFDILVRLKICTKPSNRFKVSSTTQISLNISQTQSLEAIDAERRRQKALKALKERLNKTEANDSTNSQWGNDTSNEITRKLLNQEHTIDEQTIYATTSQQQSDDNNTETIININKDLDSKNTDTVVDIAEK